MHANSCKKLSFWRDGHDFRGGGQERCPEIGSWLAFARVLYLHLVDVCLSFATPYKLARAGQKIIIIKLDNTKINENTEKQSQVF